MNGRKFTVEQLMDAKRLIMESDRASDDVVLKTLENWRIAGITFDGETARWMTPEELAERDAEYARESKRKEFPFTRRRDWGDCV